MLDHKLPNRSADEPFPFKPREGPMTDRTQEPGEGDGGDEWDGFLDEDEKLEMTRPDRFGADAQHD